MLRFAVFAILVAAASAYNPFGPVEGIVPCGSKGTVREVRVTECTKLPCTIIKGRTYDIEVDFEPFAKHDQLTVLVSVIRGGEETEIVHDTIPAPVAPGNGYTLAYPWTVSGQLGNGLVALRIQLTGDDVTELCGLATAEVKDVIF